MKLIRYIIIAVALVMGLASCSVTRHSAFAPGVTQLTLQMDDLEYLGESEISVEYRRYLGFIAITDKVNGEVYKRDGIKRFPIYINQSASDELLPKLGRAAYKLAEEFPQADYFIVTSQTKQRYQLFLGSHVTSKAKVKAYSFKK